MESGIWWNDASLINCCTRCRLVGYWTNRSARESLFNLKVGEKFLLLFEISDCCVDAIFKSKTDCSWWIALGIRTINQQETELTLKKKKLINESTRCSERFFFLVFTWKSYKKLGWKICWAFNKMTSITYLECLLFNFQNSLSQLFKSIDNEQIEYIEANFIPTFD